MDEYKKIAKVYKQTESKKLLLIPAIKRSIPVNSMPKVKRLLDLGCGTGDFFEILKKHKYKYSGLDISESMLSIAKNRYPEIDFKLCSVTKFSRFYNQKFDIVLINLVLHILDKTQIIKTLKEIKKVSNKNTKIVIGLPHPDFDHYMRAGLLNKKNVKTSFKGYFEKNKEYILNYKYDSIVAKFKAKHWTLQDYFTFFISTGYKISNIDECRPDQSKVKVLKSKIREKEMYPTYLVVTLSL